ncbi:Arc family DNA-binding protein [Pseudomonas sp. 21LCFQ02]|nr:Arc family DNA-binding protein [Pseudomonas sp. 21LCFQ02]
MPASLREAVEESARDSKRSLNAEIVTRLELSLVADDRSRDFISAEQARELATLADTNIEKKVHDLIQRSIAHGAIEGHSPIFVSLLGLGLIYDRPEHMEVMDRIVRRLEERGYKVAQDGTHSLTLEY